MFARTKFQEARMNTWRKFVFNDDLNMSGREQPTVFSNAENGESKLSFR